MPRPFDLELNFDAKVYTSFFLLKTLALNIYTISSTRITILIRITKKIIKFLIQLLTIS